MAITCFSAALICISAALTCFSATLTCFSGGTKEPPGCQCDSGWHTSCVCMFATASTTLHGPSYLRELLSLYAGDHAAASSASCPAGSWPLKEESRKDRLWCCRPRDLEYSPGSPQICRHPRSVQAATGDFLGGAPMSRHYQTMIVYHQTLKVLHFILIYLLACV